MTLAELTALMSRVLRDRPELQGDRKVELFIQDCIEAVRDRPPVDETTGAITQNTNATMAIREIG